MTNDTITCSKSKSKWKYKTENARRLADLLGINEESADRVAKELFGNNPPNNMSEGDGWCEECNWTGPLSVSVCLTSTVTHTKTIGGKSMPLTINDLDVVPAANGIGTDAYGNTVDSVSYYVCPLCGDIATVMTNEDLRNTSYSV